MNKTSLIKRSQEIEGLTGEERSALLGLLRSHKKYGLVWEDKPEDVEECLVAQLAEEIANLDFGKEKLKIYIFSPARYAFNDKFAEVSDNVLLVALPAAIYDAYEKGCPSEKKNSLRLEQWKPMKIITMGRTELWTD